MGISLHAKIKDYINTWEQRCYKNGLPDEAPIGLEDKVPSYKKIALALLTNDLNLNSLGYANKKSKYYNILKRIEIDGRPPKIGDQLRLNL